MKILHISHSDISGGGGSRAAYRLHQALRQSGLESSMCVKVATSGDWTVQGPKGKLARVLARARPTIGALPTKLLRTTNPILHSPAWVPSGLSKHLNTADADVLHLHWINGEMLSIAELGRLRKPLVWTLHDMWAFCGAEHLAWDDRWKTGYRVDNRPAHESGFDLNRWTWARKRKHWRRPWRIVTPSRWLADCARNSALMQGWPVTVAPNPIDIERWQPIDRPLARKLLGLPIDAPLLLFGAIGGGRNYHKGFDLLLAAIGHLQLKQQDLQLLVFGQLAPREPPALGFPIHYCGYLHDDLSLRALYSAADVMLVPSRQEAFGQTASEAHACGTPVVAFNIGGLPDIVQHQQTGYLAQAFDPADFAQGIEWVLADSQRRAQLGAQARQRAVACFAYPVVAAQYRQVYEAATAARHG